MSFFHAYSLRVFLIFLLRYLIIIILSSASWMAIKIAPGSYLKNLDQLFDDKLYILGL